MVISQTAEYALRAIVHLAANRDQFLKTHDLAVATKVPAAYLSKVLQALGRADLVRSHRGIHGGFVLARDAKEITVLEVVNAVDPLKRIQSCPLGIEGHGVSLCPLHRSIDDVIALVEKSFASCTVEDFLATKNKNRPLCDTLGGTGSA